jgi:UV DNA damage endonuclease
MKIGYPCINRSIGCSTNKTFRLKSYSEKNLIEKVSGNLDCLDRILRFNVSKSILFFRISSDIVPFASHPVCRFNWQKRFAKTFREIGDFIIVNDIRISMHPDQFTLINSLDHDIYRRTIAELEYHADVLNLMELDCTAKIQIHIGGVYGDKAESMKRFIKRYKMLSAKIRRRLVIENDDRNYTLSECLAIYAETGVPILFDSFHHSINCSGETLRDSVRAASKTWSKNDGILMMDYSSQKKDAPAGTHAEHINTADFKCFLAKTVPFDFDVMLEIKDKETSAFKAINIAERAKRFYLTN